MLSNPTVRYILLGVGGLLAVCLLGALVLRFVPSLPFISRGGSVTPVQTPISFTGTEEPATGAEATEGAAETSPTPLPAEGSVISTPATEEATPLPTSTAVPIVTITSPTKAPVTPVSTKVVAPTPTLIIGIEATPSSTPAMIAQATEPPGGVTVPETGAALSQVKNPAAQVLEIGNLINNGDFEGGFSSTGAGNHWEIFQNGAAMFGWYDDTWLPVVISGTHTQLIEISRSTKTDSFAGIYQTVRTVPGANYYFSMGGLVRSTEGDIKLSDYGYRILLAFDQKGGSDWQALDEKAWIELPWDEQLRISDTFRKEYFTKTVTAEGNNLTVFIRCWKKWANNGEGDFDVDEIRLVGPIPGTATPPAQATVTPAVTPSASAEPTAQLPVSGARDEGDVSRWLVIAALFALLVAFVAWRTIARRRA